MKSFLFVLLCMVNYCNWCIAQSPEVLSPEQEAISKLNFLVGDWAGPGVSYASDGTKADYYDTEYVRFDLGQKVLLINARGEKDGVVTYQLHTIIYYDKDAGHYWYTPYSGGQPRRFLCHLMDKQFLCKNEAADFRLTFKRKADGSWNEFGERLDNGLWKKTFETILLPVTK